MSLLLVLPALASATIDEDWESGKAAFREGRYTEALERFEAAREQGLDSPAVHYNIGVTQYRLQQYDHARDTFELIARRFPAMRGLADYNLGLIAARVGDEDRAREHFLDAYEAGDGDLTLQRMAAESFGGLGPRVSPASRWSGMVGVRAGNDDNVVLRDETGLPLGTTTESPVVDAFASFSGPRSGDGGFNVEGSAYAVRYLDADDYDQVQLAGGAYYDWRPDRWRIRLGLRASMLTLGGDGYDRKAGLQARVIRYLGTEAAVDFRYSHDDVTNQSSQYVGVDGTRRQYDLRYRWYRDGHRWQLRYALETNDRLDPALSPERSRFAVDYGYQPVEGFGFDAGIDFRQSDYDELETARQEDLVTLRAGVSYSFRDSWTLLLDIEASDNDSTDDAFSYDRRRITLGAVRVF